MKVTPEQIKADADAYLIKFHDRLPDFVNRHGGIPEGQPWSLAWTRDLGRFFRAARQQAGVTRYDLAEAMGG